MTPYTNCWSSSSLQITFLHLVRCRYRIHTLVAFPTFQTLTMQCTVHVSVCHKIYPDYLRFLFATPKPSILIKFTKQGADTAQSHACFCQVCLNISEFHLPFSLALDLSYSPSSLLISQLVPNQSIQKAAAKIIPFMLLRPCQTFIFKSNASSSASSSQLFS